jgi:WD40 repeat protein
LSGVFAPFAFRPDGKALIAYADHARIVAIELASGRVLWTTQPLPGALPDRIGFSADGSMVLALRWDGSGNAWLYRLNVLTGKECAELLRGWGRIAVAPRGELAAVGRTEKGEAYIDLVDLPSGQRTASWPVGGPRLSVLVFSPDAKSLYVSAYEDDWHKGTGRIWALDTQRATGPLMAHTLYGTYAPSADRLVTRTDDILLVRDAGGRVRGSGLTVFPGEAASYGRTMLAPAWDNRMCFWQISAEAEPVADKEAVLTGKTRSTRFRGYNVWTTDLWASGQIAVSPSLDAAGQEQVRLFDPATGRPFGVPAPHHPGWHVRSFALSPDGRYFATGSNPDAIAAGELRLWDTSTGRLLFAPIPHTNYVSAIAFHPDGKLVATGDYSGLVRTWDLATGREIGRPLPQGEIVLALSFNSDGNVLAVALAHDHTNKPGTRISDATTRQPIGELLPSTVSIGQIEFQLDGRALLASTGQSTQLWDTTQGRELTEPLLDEGIGGFCPDGHAFLTVGKDGSVKVRDATTALVHPAF